MKIIKPFCVFRSCPYYESVLGSRGKCNEYMCGYRISSSPEAMIKNDAKVVGLVHVALNLAKEVWRNFHVTDKECAGRVKLLIMLML